MNSSEQQIFEHHAAAQKALQQGLLREVHRHCQAILALDQNFADAWFMCGVIAAHNGQFTKSAKILGNAVMLAPKNPEYRAELGKQRARSPEVGKAL